jgi:hypothetical protein
MAKKTVLEITQNILEEMGSDLVTSISDTAEASQVAAFVRQAYEYLMNTRGWDFNNQMTTLESPSDSNNPTSFNIPDNMHEIKWMKYNNEDVVYANPQAFDDLIKGRDTSLSTVTSGGFYNDRDPSYWTSYDGSEVVMDAYKSSEGSNLLEINLRVYANVEPSWTHSDTFYPPVPLKYFNLLEDEARSLCYNFILKQPSGKIEKNLVNRQAQLQSSHGATGQGKHISNRKIDYGRK